MFEFLKGKVACFICQKKFKHADMSVIQYNYTDTDGEIKLGSVSVCDKCFRKPEDLDNVEPV